MADDNWTIRVDLACDTCGYNLRGLLSSGYCPECGAAIVKTLAYHESAGRIPFLRPSKRRLRVLYWLHVLLSFVYLLGFIIPDCLYGAAFYYDHKRFFSLPALLMLVLVLLVAPLAAAFGGAVVALTWANRDRLPRRRTLWMLLLGMSGFAVESYVFFRWGYFFGWFTV